MPNNFVIVGPASGGKSTLGGYILYHSAPDYFRSALLQIEKIVAVELGNQYDGSQRLANLLDTARDERLPSLKPQNQDVITTTIYTHYQSVRIDNRNFAIIDTPGATNRTYERTKGILNGDIAVFMIELSKLLDSGTSSSIEQFLAPLFIWEKLGRSNQTRIIVFSKMDQEDFSQKRFEAGRDLLRRILEDKTISPVPIAVSVDKLTDHNIFRESPDLGWYKGPTLIDILFQKVRYIPVTNRHNLFMHIDKLHDLKYDLVVQGKVMQGGLKRGDVIKLCPLIFRNREHVTLQANADTIQLVKSEEYQEEGKAGDIIGVKISDLRVDGRRCHKADFDTIGSTCIVDQHTPLLLGSVLRFSLNDPKEAEQFDFMDTVRVAWFGKTLGATVVHKSETEGSFKIDLELSKAGAAIPLSPKDQLMFSQFYLITQGDSFISAKLEGLGEVTSIVVYLPLSCASKIDATLNYFQNLPVEAEQVDGRHCLVFHPQGGVKQIIAKIRLFFRRIESDKEPVEVLMKEIDIELIGQKGDQPSMSFHIQQ